jgi:hypothetical protein
MHPARHLSATELDIFMQLLARATHWFEELAHSKPIFGALTCKQVELLIELKRATSAAQWFVEARGAIYSLSQDHATNLFVCRKAIERLERGQRISHDLIKAIAESRYH